MSGALGAGTGVSVAQLSPRVVCPAASTSQPGAQACVAQPGSALTLTA